MSRTDFYLSQFLNTMLKKSNKKKKKYQKYSVHTFVTVYNKLFLTITYRKRIDSKYLLLGPREYQRFKGKHGITNSISQM